jgi:hypothetical protein
MKVELYKEVLEQCGFKMIGDLSDGCVRRKRQFTWRFAIKASSSYEISLSIGQYFSIFFGSWSSFRLKKICGTLM